MYMYLCVQTTAMISGIVNHVVCVCIIICVIQRLEDAQAQKEAVALNEQKLKVELAKVKNHSSNGKLVSEFTIRTIHI